MRVVLKAVLPLLAIVILIAAYDVRSQDLVERVTFNAVTYDDGSGGSLRNPWSASFDDRARELFICDAGNGRIVIYDDDLTPRYSFTHFVTPRSGAELTRGEPRATVTNSQGDIFIVDNLAPYIDVADFRGAVFTRIYPNRLLGDTTLQLRPQALAIDSADNLYVIVSGDKQTVLVLDRDYNLKRQFGQKGTAPKDFSAPVAIAEHKGLLYISDMYAIPALKVFDTTGTYLRGFGAHDVDRADLSFPSAIVISEDTSGAPLIWVADNLRQVIKVYDETGTWLANVGGFGDQLGEFRYPSGLAIEGNSTFFVVERFGNRIQRFVLVP
jgi:sugar lactone lactonase YvrE